MAERAGRDPLLDQWQQNLATQLRAVLAAERVTASDLARAMGMKQTALSRRLTGRVSFTAEELLFLADFMNKNIDDIMAAAKARATNPCLSHRKWATAQRESGRLWPHNGYLHADLVWGSGLHVA